METEPEKKKEKRPTTERQAFTVWVLSLMVVGIGVGVSVCGLNGVANRAVGDQVPGPNEFLVVGALVVFIGVLILRSVPKTLKVWERFAKDKSAVSPVIAVVLMVAITVVLAAVVFVMVSDIGDHAPTSTPNVGFSRDGPDGLIVVASSVGLTWGDFEVSGCGNVPPDNETLDAGDRISACAGEVVVTHKPTRSLVYRGRF